MVINITRFWKSNQLIFIGILIILGITSVQIITASYTKQNFIINQDSKVFLDLHSDKNYNGSITVTVTIGAVNATVNGKTKEVVASSSQTFLIVNTSTIYFALASTSYAEGYFEIELNLAINGSGRNPITITIGILAAFLVVLSTVTYYIRAKRMEPKPDEEKDEFLDEETLRRRKEAAGAEKRYLGLDDKI
ncbi:MAG: hypothetical protein ACTSXO_06520 [Candidatus Heimdallarchaeota archaeon]